MSFPTRTLEHDFARLSLQNPISNVNSNTANCNTTALQKIDAFQGYPRHNNPSPLERRYQNPVVNTNSSSQKTCKMEVAKIRFTQQSVSPYFSDGITKVETLAQQLARGEVFAKEIPSIRVVRHKNQFWSLDNRRLRAFKDGLVETIDVMIVDLKDTNIAKEFWDKLSSKSATESGIIRKETQPSTQILDSAVYAFNKIVLNWTFEQIALPMPNYKKISLPDSYNNRSTYYTSFVPLIFEEARAILQTGIQEAKSRFLFSLTVFKPAKKADNPSEIKFNVLPGSEKDMKSGDVLLFVSKKYPGVQLIALTNYNPQGAATTEFSFKAVINTELLQKYPLAFEKRQEWEAKPLGSLITLQRMYEACQKAQGMQPLSLENNIAYGHCLELSHNLNVRQNLGDLQATELNPSQIETINKFLRLPKGLFLVQGPPGTGKTTTIIELLSALQQRGEKILVCAPANKAVQILAKRFMDKFPEVPIILVGAEDPPPNSTLNGIFMDSWCDRQIRALTEINETVLNFQLHKLLEGDAKLLSSRLENACIKLMESCEKFSSFVKEASKYKLTCLKNVDQQNAKFQETVHNYLKLIFSHEFPWKETSLYYAQKEDSLLEMPYYVSLARSYLSEISILLSSLQEQLQIAENNATSTGLQAELLNHSQLIFSTLSVSGQQRMKNITSIDTLIVDEAGQATEAETLIPLTMANPKKCLLIGDIKQLPATVISQDAEKLKFGRSMMERLIKDCKYPYTMLDTQYRMHPEISRWPSQYYYGGELKNHASVCSPDHAIKGMGKSFPFLGPYAFININGQEQKGSLGRSFFNQAEIKTIALIIDYLAKSIKVEEHVAVISFYAEQINQINTALKNKYPNIKVNTVDGFQGGESDIIIISCVRANLDKQIGFLKDAKRLNVALTRAKFSLIILGNKSTLMRSDIAELVSDAGERNTLYEEEVLQKLVIEKQTQKNPPPLMKLNRKTELCRNYALKSSCRNGDQCNYAHGTAELNQGAKKLEPKRVSSPPKK